MLDKFLKSLNSKQGRKWFPVVEGVRSWSTKMELLNGNIWTTL